MVTKNRLSLALIGVAFTFISCGAPDSIPIPNERPHVRLTGGPVAGDSVAYSTEFFWTGWDEDGLIDHYQYAIDIPDEFTFDEINEPDAPGIAWRDTTAFRASFRFTTPYPDTIISPGGLMLPERYKGDHTFYVRAVDNEGGTSSADYLSFTARNITPRTQFTVPQVSRAGQILDVGRVINVAWEGVDPDSPDPRRMPAYYEWKLIQVLVSQVPQEDVTYAVLTAPGPDYPWHRISADTTTLSVGLETPKGHLLVIRAIDEAGATENRFLRGRNALLLSARGGTISSPTLIVTERALGSHTFPADGAVAEFEVPINRPLKFYFSYDADAYGGVLQGYNYGIDVEDVTDDGPNSGFKGWSLIPCTFDPIVFRAPGLHVLTVKCRDTGGGVTIGTILLTVIAFPMDREVLYVDDYRQARQGPINDALMDNRVRAMLEAVGVTEFYKFDAWGDQDLNSQLEVLRLSDLARYRIVLWSNLGSGLGSRNALVTSAVCGRGRIIQSYVAAGGSLWVYGDQMWGSFKQFGTGECNATIGKEADGIMFGESDFPCEFMKICGGDFREVRNFQRNGLVRVNPTEDALRDTFPFPAIGIDSTLFTLPGLPFVQAMFTPTFDETGGLDTLYTMTAAVAGSGFNNKPVAFRYRDPDPGALQGPVAIFGFSYHLLKPGSAVAEGSGYYSGTGVHGLAASMMNWFRKNRSVRGGS